MKFGYDYVKHTEIQRSCVDEEDESYQITRTQPKRLLKNWFQTSVNSSILCKMLQPWLAHHIE